jgi:hypothetical protein
MAWFFLFALLVAIVPKMKYIWSIAERWLQSMLFFELLFTCGVWLHYVCGVALHAYKILHMKYRWSNWNFLEIVHVVYGL